MRFAILDSSETVVSICQAPNTNPPTPPPGGRVIATMRAELGWVFSDNQLVAPTPTLTRAQAAQMVLLRAACAAQITGGASSSALGSPHTYPTTANDQANMIASVTASLLPGLGGAWSTPFWCEDQSGNWAMQEHSAAQIQQAGSDIKAAIVAAQTKLRTLTAEIQAASTIAAVQAITW